MTDTRTAEPLRRGRPGYDQRGILEVAVAAFNEHGYDATSIGMLAERLGLSKSAIYHHVASKDELLALALDEALDGLEGALRAAEEVPGTAADRLALVLREAVLVLADRLPYVTLLLRVRGNTVVERAALQRRRAFDHAVAGLVAEARDEGALRADADPAVVARLLFGMINSLTEWYDPAGALTPDELADTILALALRTSP
ncbi:TetR/AcrR family transcriptional regulator [Leifsonia sp. TF02-11]|uniref:TetR/AcrR family transcriptional regulator n=1 Tax=Leifsonia sp. TF02-11 TaxID=2815212 RepID=UPI001AA0B64E|nr:TetR/AcrR family transcriptional regulator [Leifsonia sp. TF02-11]MBO1738865.1 TetR family transcriptional regulator [Leifsonia sp. TF02-11]